MRQYLFLFIIMLTACQNENHIPEHILPQETMQAILMEFHLLEAKIDNLHVPRDSAKQMYEHFEPQVYDKYGVDPALYEESLSFYMGHPALLHDIYEGVVDSLMVREKNHRID